MPAAVTPYRRFGAVLRPSLAQAAAREINVAVVGLLGSTLYNRVWTNAVLKPADFAASAGDFVLLIVWRAPPQLVVVLSALAGIGLAFPRWVCRQARLVRSSS
jgi:hypothetical protein